MKGGWHLLSTWRKKELPMQALPLTIDFMLAVVGLALACGDTGLAAAFAVGCHCFLRAGEFMHMLSKHVVIEGNQGVVLLPHTKKGYRDVVTITDAMCKISISSGTRSGEAGPPHVSNKLATWKRLSYEGAGSPKEQP
eukprot:4085143-Karenia_brevis.AAC.1